MSRVALGRPPVKEPPRSVLRKLRAMGPDLDGKIAAVEMKSGEYFIGDTLIEAAKKGREKFPKAVFYFVRIGFPAVDFQSGGLLKS